MFAKVISAEAHERLPEALFSSINLPAAMQLVALSQGAKKTALMAAVHAAMSGPLPFVRCSVRKETIAFTR